MDWRDDVAVDPSVCHGQACVRGTRVLVSVVLDKLAAQLPPEEIVRRYPGLTPKRSTRASPTPRISPANR